MNPDQRIFGMEDHHFIFVGMARSKPRENKPKTATVVYLKATSGKAGVGGSPVTVPAGSAVLAASNYRAVSAGTG